MGNIFLKCIEKQVDFLQILREIAEQNEEVYDASLKYNTVLPIESAIEYFALSLGGRVGSFLRIRLKRWKSIKNCCSCRI